MNILMFSENIIKNLHGFNYEKILNKKDVNKDIWWVFKWNNNLIDYTWNNCEIFGPFTQKKAAEFKNDQK